MFMMGVFPYIYPVVLCDLCIAYVVFGPFCDVGYSLGALDVLLGRIGDADSAPTSNTRSCSASFLRQSFSKRLWLGFSIILMRGMLFTIMMILDAAGKATFLSVQV